MAHFTVGPHQVDIEGDIFFVRWRGDPELGPLVSVYDRLTGFIAERGYALVLFDLRQAGIPGTAARRYAGQWWRQRAPGTAVVASYGMAAPLRSMMVFINRALTLVRGPGPVMTELFNDESGARAWLAARREQLRSVRA